MADDIVNRREIIARLAQIKENRRNVKTTWTEHKSESGEVYYFDSENPSLTSWEKPDDLKTPAELILSEIPWKEYKTPEGKSYFHNPSTGETRWETPQSLLAVKQIIEDFEKDPQNGSEHVQSSRRVDRQSVEDSEDESTDRGQTPLNGKSLSNSPALAGDSFRSKSSGITGPSKAESIDREEEALDVFAVKDINSIDKKLAGEAFRKFLDEKNVPSNLNWENCVKMIQSDKRFDIWKRFSERKQNFNLYKIQKQKQEKEDQRKRLEKARENFEKMLSATDKITYETPYRDAERIFASDKIWRAVPERERESLYQDVMVVVEQRDKEQAEKDRVESMEKLANILYGISHITYKTTWFDCQKQLAECDAFISDPIVKKISKLDALTVFKEHIYKLEREHREEVKSEKRQRIRTHRKIREAYMTLLDELTRQGIVHSMAKWKACFPIIRNDPRFISMQDQTGSNALDLFKLFVKDLQNRFEDDLDKISEILEKEKFTVGADSEFPDFYRIIHKDPHFNAIDRGNIKQAFDLLKSKAQEGDKSKQSEKQREEDRKQKLRDQQEADFIQMLKDSKVVEQSTKWLTVQEKLSNDAAYLAIRDEETRIKLFHQYLSSLSSSSSKKKREMSRSTSPKKKKKTRSDEKESSSKSPRSKNTQNGDHEKKPSRHQSRKQGSPEPESSQSSSKHKKKKRHHHRSSSREKDAKKQPGNGEEPEGSVPLDPETLASVMSDVELERQREQLMRELGLIDD